MLEAKFGGTSESTIAGVLAMLSEGDILIVPESDLQRMKERFGKRPESSGELFGLMYSMSMDLETEKLTADTARKESGIRRPQSEFGANRLRKNLWSGGREGTRPERAGEGMDRA